ncbi:TonB-dependent receptor, partial [Methylocucumis oryzae]
ISDSLNLQFEYRYETRDNGDLSIPFFFPENFSSFYQEHTDITSYRLGGRYAFNTASSLLGSFIYQSVDSTENDLLFGDIERASSQARDGSISELQHIYQGETINIVTGAGYIDESITRNDKLSLLGLTFDNPPPDRPDATRANFYLYSTLQQASHLAITLGLSYDYWQVNHEKNEDEGNGVQLIPGDLVRQPVNPKFGIVWKPLPNATIRAAAFRTLNITRTANQTLEPTQVAGFNQFFDDDNGTIAWRYGAGFDYRFNKNIAGGIEYSERELDVPRGISTPLAWQEHVGKAYLYLTPNDVIALSAEYFYEQFNRQDYQSFTNGKINYGVTTHWLPITLHVLHPSGFGLMLRQTYVKQFGKFVLGGGLAPGDSEFYLVDLNLNYRLPRRYGMLSFGVKNLFNSHFLYQDINSSLSNTNENYFAPETTLFTQIKLAI